MVYCIVSTPHPHKKETEIDFCPENVIYVNYIFKRKKKTHTEP